MRVLPCIRLGILALFGFGLIGCLPMNEWHLEHFTDQKSYPSDDAAAMRDDLSEMLRFMKSIGLKRIDNPDSSQAFTEVVFIRDEDDHFHITVTVRGLAQIDKPGWAVVVHIESYNIGEEGAINAGHALLTEIDNWYHRPRRLGDRFVSEPKEFIHSATAPASQP